MKYVGPAKDELVKKIVGATVTKFGHIRTETACRYASSLCQLHGTMHQGKYMPGTKKDELVLQGDHLSDFLDLQWLFKEKTLKRAFARRSHLSVGSQKQEVEGILAGMRVAGGDKARKKAQYLRWEAQLKQLKAQSELVRLGDCRTCLQEAHTCECGRAKDPVPPRSLSTLQILLARRYRMWSGKEVVQEAESETDKQELVEEAKTKILAAIHSDEEAMGNLLGGPDGSVENAGGSPLQEYVMMNVVEQHDTRLDLATVRLAGSGDATDDPELNYLVVGPVLRFKVNRCKTDRSYAEQQKKIGGDPFRLLTPNARLQRTLKQYLRVCRIRPGDYLFTCKGGKPLCRKDMSEQIIKFFKRKLGTKVTMTDWRKLKPTANHSENRKAMERDAYVSGHSMATQATFYIDAVPSAVLRQIAGR
jgi:hypothetical protein